MKKQVVLFLMVILTCLIKVHAVDYQPLTLSNEFAVLTIDQTRLIETPKEEGFFSIYAVPHDANVTITLLQNQETPVYIGAAFQRTLNGDVNYPGKLLETSECLLNAQNVLQQVYSQGSSLRPTQEDDAWIDDPNLTRTAGTYTFCLSAMPYAGWTFSPLCGFRMTAGKGTFHGFLNSFLPNKIGSALVAFQIEQPPLTFTDVAENSPYLRGIQWAVANGITRGTSDTTFSPYSVCTHAQILTLLWRASGSPTPVIPGSTDFETAIQWAREQGLLSEQDTVSGNQPCTRSQAVMYLWKLAGCPNASASIDFSDVNRDSSTAKAIAWAVEQEITNGTSAATFSPDAACTRGQIVTFLYRS